MAIPVLRRSNPSIQRHHCRGIVNSLFDFVFEQIKPGVVCLEVSELVSETSGIAAPEPREIDHVVGGVVDRSEERTGPAGLETDPTQRNLGLARNTARQGRRALKHVQRAQSPMRVVGIMFAKRGS